MFSIRVRVLAATLGLVLVGLVASAGAIYGALQWVLLTRLDQQLSSVERPVVTALNQIDRQRQLEGVVPPGGFVKLFDSEGSELYSFSVPEVQQPPPSPMLPSSLPDRSNPFSVGSKTVGDPGYRVEVWPVGVIQAPGLVPISSRLVVGFSLRNTTATLQYLILIEGLVGAATLGAVGAVGFWIVRLGLRPLDRMAATAARITAGDLTLRVDADTRTEIGRLGAALNVMLARIEDGFRQRAASEDRLRRFVADASHVGQQVVHDLAQPLGVADDRHRLTGAQHDLAVGICRPAGVYGLRGDGREVDLLLAQRTTLVEPRQQQHLVDQARHPRGLVLDAPHGQREVLRPFGGAAAEELRVAADRRERRPELVRGVCHEPAQALF